MNKGFRLYFEDHWNVFDVLGLLFLSGGLLLRCFDSSSSSGQGLYALSAPLLVARILFFAQILSSQGPMVQVSLLVSTMLASTTFGPSASKNLIEDRACPPPPNETPIVLLRSLRPHLLGSTAATDTHLHP